MEKESLVQLVQDAQRGDNQAMDALFTEFYNDVYYFALKTVKDSDLACDITQETFLKVIQNIGELKEPAAFVTWMKQIAYHQCTHYFSKKKEVLVEEDEDGNTIFDTLPDDGEMPAEVLEQEEFRRTILSMIEQLTEEQRAAVLLYYFDELTVSQIAQIQGVSEGTVKSRLNYARKAIKKSVESYEKKHDVKLHSVALLPLLLLFFGKAQMPKDKAEKVRGAVFGTSRKAAATITTKITGGIIMKLAKLPFIAKIIAGVVAAALLVGAGVLIFGGSDKEDTKSAKSKKSEDTSTQATGSEKNQPDGTRPNRPADKIPSRPDNITPTQPDNTTPSQPGNTTPNQPDNTTPNQPGNTTPNQPGNTTPNQPDNTTPNQPGNTTPNQPEEEEAPVVFSYRENNDGTITITSLVDYPKHLVIPSQIDGREVTAIAQGAFSPHATCTSVTIPASVKTIGIEAFCYNTSITTVTIAGATEIGESAFESCRVLETVTISGAASIGREAFDNCDRLKTVTLSENITHIGSEAFTFCTALQTITIPGSVTSIGGAVFSSCRALETVVISEGVESLGASVFDDCIKLTSVTLPTTLKEIHVGAFTACKSLETVTIPEGVTYMGFGIFYNCTSLRSVTIPGSVVTIPHNTFMQCTALETVIISEGIQTIGSQAFSGCTNLKSITLPSSLTTVANNAFDATLQTVYFKNEAHITTFKDSFPSGTTRLLAS